MAFSSGAVIPVGLDGIGQRLQTVLGIISAALCLNTADAHLQFLGLCGQVKEIGHQHCLTAVRQIVAECHDADTQLLHLLFLLLHDTHEVLIEVKSVLFYNTEKRIHTLCRVNTENNIYSIRNTTLV